MWTLKYTAVCNSCVMFFFVSVCNLSFLVAFNQCTHMWYRRHTRGDETTTSIVPLTKFLAPVCLCARTWHYADAHWFGAHAGSPSQCAFSECKTLSRACVYACECVQMRLIKARCVCTNGCLRRWMPNARDVLHVFGTFGCRDRYWIAIMGTMIGEKLIR